MYISKLSVTFCLVAEPLRVRKFIRRSAVSEKTMQKHFGVASLMSAAPVQHIHLLISCSSLTKLVLGNQWLRDTRWPTAKLILSGDSEDVLLPFNEFGDGAAGALQGRGDSYPANLIVLVVLLLQNVVQDLAAAVVLRRLPVTDDRGVSDLIESEVDWSTRFVCGRAQSG